MTPADYLEAWRTLPSPASSEVLEAREVPAGSGVWVARDHLDRQHLLVQVDGESQLGVQGTHGLGIDIKRHAIPGLGEGWYIDLVCLEDAVISTFAAVAADISKSVALELPAARPTLVEEAIGEWRWFWGVDPSRMTVTDAVGLFGELWFLNRWARASAESVAAWEGSSGLRHDFVWPATSVEVKTTSRSGAVEHTIEHLEQLDGPITGDLYLFSLRIARDPLAANSVNGLAKAAIAALDGQPLARSDLLAKLATRGYSPAGREQSVVTYRVVEEALYHVADGFPRLTEDNFSGGLPQAITKVSYVLDMNACGEWRTSATPENWTP